MGKRILIVDDEEKVLFTLKSSLEKLGDEYEIVTALNGHEALRQIQEEPVGLVITDLSMPGMDGLELTRSIQAISPQTPVIWITAYGSSESEAEAQRLNVHRYLHKPLDIFEIRQIARDALETVRRRGATPLSATPDKLQESLIRLYDETGAYSVLVITTGGQVVDIAGTTSGLDVDTLSALVAGNFLAAHEIARLLGQESSFKLSYHESDTHNVYAYGVGEGYLLVIVFGHETKPGIVWFYARRAVEELTEHLANVQDDRQIKDVLDEEFGLDLQKGLDDLFETADEMPTSTVLNLLMKKGEIAGVRSSVNLDGALAQGLVDETDSP